MKFQLIIIGAAVLAISACKTTYKATDKPMSTTDSTASARDTTSTRINNMDSARIDSTKQSLRDSVKMNATTDSMLVRQATDSALTKKAVDSTMNQSKADVTTGQTVADSSTRNSMAPADVEPAFSKQYPGATNVVWSGYDSLAAIPIDMRMTGWKKMNTDDHMVKFDLKDETYYAWYDNKGKWIGSASPLTDVSKLPAAVNTAVKNAIKTRYTGYTVSQVNQEFQTGKKSYEIELTKDDNKVRMLVSSAGKVTQIFKYTADKKE